MMKAEIIAKNKVKSITVFSCPLKNEERINKKYKKSETTYDKNGNIIEFIEYNQGKIDKWEQYVYDSESRVVEQITYNGYGYDKSRFHPIKKHISNKINNADEERYKPIIEIDRNGKKLETTFFLNGKLRSKRYFNKKGFCIEDIEYKNGKNIVGHKKFTEDGKLLSDKNYLPNGRLTNSLICEYDINGRLIRMKKVKGDGSVLKDRNLIYDNNGNLIDDFDILKEEDKLRNPDLKFSDDNKIGYRNKYYYNDEQLLIEHKVYLGENLLMIYESKYTFEEE